MEKEQLKEMNKRNAEYVVACTKYLKDQGFDVLFWQAHLKRKRKNGQRVQVCETECMICERHKNNSFHGVSIQNPNDPPNMKLGRYYAFDRAYKFYKEKMEE